MPYIPVPDGWVPEGHADSEGDVVFLLDTEHTATTGQYRSLKVSSYILGRASKIFKAMFDPRFTGDEKFSPSNPREVRLSEDDCQATVWLMFALHSQDLPEGRMSLQLLKRLAMLCDKYDSARAMQPWSRHWLHEWCGGFSDSDWWSLLWISYAFQDQESFYEITERLVYKRTTDITKPDEDSIDALGLSLLPSGFPGKLDQSSLIKSQRIKAVQNLLKLLKQTRITYMAKVNGCAAKHKVKVKCNRSQLTEHFEEELKRLDLRCTKADVEQWGASFYLFKMSYDFKPCVLPSNANCTPLVSGAGDYDKTMVGRARESMHGLCMTCVKQGKLSGSHNEFYAWQSVVDEDVVEVQSLKRKAEETLAPADQRRRGTEMVPTGKIAEDSKEHNCMSPTRRKHQQCTAHAQTLSSMARLPR